jgi:ribosomal protein S18 acetylase RimI-like enzyme
MATRKRRGLVAVSRLGADELRAAQALRDVCDAQEGLTLKLRLAPAHAGAAPDGMPDEPAATFLYYHKGALVGFAALDGGGLEAELCGMVHPRHRRKGIGRALLAAAVAACRRDGVARLLLICEEASRSGRAFVAAIGGARDFDELHLEREAVPGQSIQGARAASLSVRPAGDEDIGALARVLVAAFGGQEERTRRRLVAELREPDARFYVAEAQGTVVASLKVYLGDGRAGIYAFGVLPEYRRRGYGRELLLRTCNLMAAEGYPHIYLEVDTDNEPAKALYRSCGFHETTTYVYYTVPLLEL